MQRPTIEDVAERARVSVTTVDRVLNNRGGVAAKSVTKVQEAIKAVGYVPDAAAVMLAKGRSYRFCFVLPDGETGFVGSLLSALEVEVQRARLHRIEVETVRVPPFDAPAIAMALAGLGPSTDGIAVMGSNNPSVMRELARLKVQGTARVSLVADLPGSDISHYIGPNNTISGRTAGYFMGQFLAHRPAQVMVLAGSLLARDHVERRLGFETVLREKFPNIEVLRTEEGHDDPDLVERLVREKLQSGTIDGLYSIGAGTSGLIRALANAPMDHRPITIAHELTPAARQGLADNLIDLVIDQDPATEIARALSILIDLADDRDVDPRAGHTQIDIISPENMPESR